MGKKKAEAVDGLGPRERQRIASAIRQVWYQSRARKLAIKRCTDEDGFLVCSECPPGRQRTPKIQIDHIKACGPVDSEGFITRLFCPSKGLKGLCPPCHRKKTASDKKRLQRRGAKLDKAKPKWDNED